MSRAEEILNLFERVQIAAGILIKSGTEVLLLKRSQQVFDPGLWGIPGGSLDRPTDNILQTAIRETMEETKIVISPNMIIGHYVVDAGKHVKRIWSPTGEQASGLKFHTFIAKIDEFRKERLRPHLNWENDDWRWVPIKDALSNPKVHPGVREVLQKLNPYAYGAYDG